MIILSLRAAALPAALALSALLPAKVAADPGGAGAPDIIVTGRISGSLTADAPEDARRAADRIPGGASIIDMADAEGRRNATLADALRLAPGVFAAPRFGPEDLRLSIRGSGLVRTGHAKGLLVLRDGVMLNAADGNFDPPTLNLGAASHLTLLRGPAALGLGATTLGGVIALESRTGRTAPGFALDAQGGSFETWGMDATGGIANHRVDGFLAFGTSGTDAYRQQAATRSVRLTGNVGFRLSPTLETRLFAGHVDFESKWPGVLTRAEYEADPRQASLVAVRRDQDNNIRQTHLASRSVWADGPHQLTLAFGVDDRFKDHATPQGILEEATETLSGSLVYALGAATGPEPIALSLGIRAASSDQQARTFAYAGGLMSPNSARKGALASSRDRKARTVELFGRAEHALTPQLVATGSLAAVWTDRRDRPSAGDPPTGGPAYDVRYDAVLPGVGLLWRPAAYVTVFAGWAQSFEPPAFFDLGGNAPLQPDRIPRLRAQRADTIELGTRGRAEALRWDITLYHGWVRGELLRLDAAGALNPPIVNAERTMRTGLESAATLDLAPALGVADRTLELAAKWDWSHSRFDADPVAGNNRVPGIPEHNAYVELAAEPVAGLLLRPNLTIRSSTRTDVFNTPGAEAGGFALLGLGAAYEAGPWRLWLDARNLADRRHVSAVNIVNRATPASALFFPGDGRAIYAGIGARF
jgi:iron complex outermembrane receptor protein